MKWLIGVWIALMILFGIAFYKASPGQREKMAQGFAIGFAIGTVSTMAARK